MDSFARKIVKRAASELKGVRRVSQRLLLDEFGHWEKRALDAIKICEAQGADQAQIEFECALYLADLAITAAVEQETKRLQTRCRDVLPMFAFGVSVPVRRVPREVREMLTERGLVHQNKMKGYITPCSSILGYANDPSTFVL